MQNTPHRYYPTTYTYWKFIYTPKSATNQRTHTPPTFPYGGKNAKNKKHVHFLHVYPEAFNPHRIVPGLVVPGQISAANLRGNMSRCKKDTEKILSHIYGGRSPFPEYV